MFYRNRLPASVTASTNLIVLLDKLGLNPRKMAQFFKANPDIYQVYLLYQDIAVDWDLLAREFSGLEFDLQKDLLSWIGFSQLGSLKENFPHLKLEPGFYKKLLSLVTGEPREKLEKLVRSGIPKWLLVP
jgi:hypothetical protein